MLIRVDRCALGLNEFVRSRHMAHSVGATLREVLDLSAVREDTGRVSSALAPCRRGQSNGRRRHGACRPLSASSATGGSA